MWTRRKIVRFENPELTRSQKELLDRRRVRVQRGDAQLFSWGQSKVWHWEGMITVEISEDALDDLDNGFLFYEAQEPGLGDYFTSCLRADIEGPKISAGTHRKKPG